ncbi:hypothetical protein FOFC_18649 [Fusarium oxysporum]|nr:hypothetical protein FOFC_18649 [Fusarium oxysporum]
MLVRSSNGFPDSRRKAAPPDIFVLCCSRSLRISPFKEATSSSHLSRLAKSFHSRSRAILSVVLKIC